MIIVPDRWSLQPKYARRINQGNPLARGIVLAYLPYAVLPYEIARGRQATLSTASDFPVLEGGQIGQSAVWYSTGNATSMYYARDTLLEPAQSLTAIAFVKRIGTVANFARPFGKTHSNGGSAPFLSYDVEYNSGGGGQNLVRANIALAGSIVGTTDYNTIDSTRLHMIGVRYNGASVNLLYNGRQVLSQAGTGNITYDTTTSGNFIVGGAASNSTLSEWSGHNYVTIVWNRALTDDEVATFYDNPWQVFGPQVVQEYFGAVFAGNIGGANEALQAITEQSAGRTGVVGQVSEALQALSDTSTGRTGAVGRATEALQAITEQAYGFTQVNVTGFAADALQSITESSTGLTGARGIAREAFQSLAESATGTVTSNAVQGYASEALQSITENSTGRTGVRGIASESLQAMTETARGLTGVRGVAVEALQPLQDIGFGESGAEPIAPTRQFGAPAWWGYEGFDGTRRPWWYRDLKDKAAEAERQRQIRIDLGIISAAESKKIKQTIRQVEKFADEIPTPAKADAYIAKAEQMAAKIERLVDDLQEEDDEQAIMQMSRFFFHRKLPAWQPSSLTRQ